MIAEIDGIPIAGLDEVGGIAAASLAEVDGLGPLPGIPIPVSSLPDPYYYYTFDDTLSDYMGVGPDWVPGPASYPDGKLDDAQHEITPPASYSGGKLNNAQYEITPGAEETPNTAGQMVKAILAYWRKTIGGEWVFTALAWGDTYYDLVLAALGSASGGLVIAGYGDSVTFPESEAIDERASLAPLNLTPTEARNVIATLWNNGIGAFWRDGAWMEPAE